jgi:hypothetical protein
MISDRLRMKSHSPFHFKSAFDRCERLFIGRTFSYARILLKLSPESSRIFFKCFVRQYNLSWRELSVRHVLDKADFFVIGVERRFFDRGRPYFYNESGLCLHKSTFASQKSSFSLLCVSRWKPNSSTRIRFVCIGREKWQKNILLRD